jgi:hypothetical protein
VLIPAEAIMFEAEWREGNALGVRFLGLGIRAESEVAGVRWSCTMRWCRRDRSRASRDLAAIPARVNRAAS